MSGRSFWFHIKKEDEKRLASRVAAVFSVLMPLTAVPQIVLLYSTKDAGSLSLTTWVLYTTGCVPFLLFGYVYKHVQLIVLNLLWLLVDVIMIVGIIMYHR